LASVLIPDPIDFAQTAALRGLGRRGDTCDVLWPQWRGRGSFTSRFCREVIPGPSASADPEAFADAVLRLAPRYDVVLPTRGVSLEALVAHRDELGRRAAVLMPSEEQFHLGIDKQATVAFCRANRVLHPDTLFVRPDRAQVEQAVAIFGFPAVIKHPRNFGGSLGVRMVRDGETLASALEALTHLPTVTEDLMIQKYLPGTLYDACLVARDGEVVGMVTQERRLMYPISGGVAGVLATVDIPELSALARSVVATLRWNGPAQIEFKWDVQHQAFSLIEINPRFWATTGAWLKAGANFPALAVDLALGRAVQPFPQLPAGLRFRYVIGRSTFALLQLWRAKGLAALRDPRSYRRTWRDFDLDDPLPDLYRLYCEGRSLLAGRRELVDRTLPPEYIPSYEIEPDWEALGHPHPL
jgi:predicted ATP-grasp superfamily ATP-dependent carboligase